MNVESSCMNLIISIKAECYFFVTPNRTISLYVDWSGLQVIFNVFSTLYSCPICIGYKVVTVMVTVILQTLKCQTIQTNTEKKKILKNNECYGKFQIWDWFFRLFLGCNPPPPPPDHQVPLQIITCDIHLNT